MHFLAQYRLLIGLSADLLTFGGGLLLARDAFLHLKDLQDRRVDEEFERRFGKRLPLKNTKEQEAKTAVKLAIRGGAILLIGFILQILARLGDG